MAEVDARLLGSWRSYRRKPMTDEEQIAALMLEPVSAPLGLTEWRTSEGSVYAKGANAVSAQVGINRRKAANQNQTPSDADILACNGSPDEPTISAPDADLLAFARAVLALAGQLTAGCGDSQ